MTRGFAVAACAALAVCVTLPAAAADVNGPWTPSSESPRGEQMGSAERKTEKTEP